MAYLAINFIEKLGQLVLAEYQLDEASQIEIIRCLHLACSNIINMKEMNSRSNVKRDQLIQEQRKKLEARMLPYGCSSFGKWVLEHKTAEDPAEGEGGWGRIPRQKEGNAWDDINACQAGLIISSGTGHDD